MAPKVSSWMVKQPWVRGKGAVLGGELEGYAAEPSSDSVREGPSTSALLGPLGVTLKAETSKCKFFKLLITQNTSNLTKVKKDSVTNPTVPSLGVENYNTTP